MSNLVLPCDVGEVSDGYHTFNELYDHRCCLFVALLHCKADISWVSKLHDDGTCLDGWFIAGINLPTGTITYHLPDRMFRLASIGVNVMERAPKWDGHVSKDVIDRLIAWIMLPEAIG